MSKYPSPYFQIPEIALEIIQAASWLTPIGAAVFFTLHHWNWPKKHKDHATIELWLAIAGFVIFESMLIAILVRCE